MTALFTYEGLEQVEIKHASAGEIIGLTGFEEVYIGETLTDREERVPLQFVDIDPPTIRSGGRIAAANVLISVVLPEELSPAMP